jgi:hypothetical protein
MNLAIQVTWLCGSGEHCLNTDNPGFHAGDDIFIAKECVRQKHEREDATREPTA